jgi:flagellin-specific chaperone FliS
MKYLKTYDKYNDSTDELVHLLYDGLLEDWEKKKDTADYLKRPNLKDVSINKVKKLLDKGADINANDPHNI